MAADICYNLGFVSLRLENVPQAEEFLMKATEYDIQHEQAIIEMARVYNMKGNYESAKEKLKSVLSMNQHNENAVLLLVKICIDHRDLKTAITELRLFRGTNPFNIKVLFQLIKLLRRAGKFDNIKELLTETETAMNDPVNNLKINSNNNSYSAISAGIHYVKGYIAWYMDNDANQAINELNLIRTDINWGRDALTLMIKIYLYWSPGFTFIDVLTRYQHKKRHLQLEVCQVLVKELKYFNNPGHNPTILTIGCLLLLASGNAAALDKAYKTLNAICKKHPKHMFAHLAFSYALNAKELPNKAIQFLNRFMTDKENKREIVFDGHENFETYQELLLSLCQIELNMIFKDQDDENLDVKESIQEVQKICLDILKKDASCSKAWELIAIATEKLGNTQSACKHFGTAWNLLNQKNVMIGYSLARMLLRLGKYMECIDIGHKVLDLDQDFEEIQVIIDHAVEKLRS